MAFGLKRVEMIGWFGADVTIQHLCGGERVVSLSIATGESYFNKQTGKNVDNSE